MQKHMQYKRLSQQSHRCLIALEIELVCQITDKTFSPDLKQCTLAFHAVSFLIILFQGWRKNFGFEVVF